MRLNISILFCSVFVVSLAYGSQFSKRRSGYSFTTFAGGEHGFMDGASKNAKFRAPEGIAIDKDGNLYVTEYGSSIVRKITPDGMVTTLAGNDMEYGSVDGTLSEARFNRPHGIAVDDQLNVYVSDMKNCTIRKITSKGLVETIAGIAGVKGYADGKSSTATFNQPEAIAVNSKGSIYIADTYNFTIRELSPDGSVKTFAGKAGEAGNSDGQGIEARFNMPIGIAIDGNDNIYIADADYDGANPGNCTIRKISPNGFVSTLAGLPGMTGAMDGTGKNARFNRPVGITVSNDGVVFIADTEAKTIRSISPTGKVETIGGKYLEKGKQTGIGNSARFNDPQAIAVDRNGSLFIADTFNDRIIKGEKLTTDSFQFVGKFISYTKSENNLDFHCKNALVRLEICSDDILRIRMRPSGVFKPNEPYVVIRYDWPENSYTIKDAGKYLEIRTSRLLVKAFKSPFRFEFCDLSGKTINKDWKEGGMGFMGKEIICRKELTETDHFFGLGQRYEESDLRGKKRTCLVTREYTPVPLFMGTDGYGIFFHNTFASEYDFTQNPYTFIAPGGDELDYYFFYGPDFKHIIQQYSRLTGFSPLPPKWAFGLFFSRWDEEVDGWKYSQGGQNGMLRSIKAAREVWDWPLDGVRIHSMGPKQNIYASPSTNWPAMLWGDFPEVDQMVKKMQDQHIHPLFWEAPGVTEGCQMFDEAVKNNYFLTLDEKPMIKVFGYLQPPGGVIDFLNPEARKWWGKYHNFMTDMGADGVAGDWHDEKSIRNTVSPSTGMKSDEFINIYSLLFNQASWDAFKERNPNKRYINFGLVYWAGGQRYPMQGTQDSHASGKNIYGEIMGCINLGMSGIPFRTFTDNVSRSLLPGLPYSRLSQYLSLTVAGERTLTMQTGNEMADWNYRFYGRLRYQLMPYIYTFAREATQTGVPLIRALVLENQDDPKTYNAYCEYLIGKDILIAPLWSDTTFFRDIYLPEGEWIDFFGETVYQGKQTINYHAPIDRVPILIKAGAIIPMAPDNQSYVDEIKSPLTIHLYPKVNSSFDLYEDDAETYNYGKGVFSITKFSYEENVAGLRIMKSVPTGTYKLEERDHIFCIHKSKKVKSVSINRIMMRNLNNNKEFNIQSEGWMHDSNSGKCWIKVKGGVSKSLDIQIINN